MLQASGSFHPLLVYKLRSLSLRHSLQLSSVELLLLDCFSLEEWSLPFLYLLGYFTSILLLDRLLQLSGFVGLNRTSNLIKPLTEDLSFRLGEFFR